MEWWSDGRDKIDDDIISMLLPVLQYSITPNCYLLEATPRVT
jgi:hypothetical protein